MTQHCTGGSSQKRRGCLKQGAIAIGRRLPEVAPSEDAASKDVQRAPVNPTTDRISAQSSLDRGRIGKGAVRKFYDQVRHDPRVRERGKCWFGRPQVGQPAIE